MPRLTDERAVEHLHPNLRFDLLWRYGTDLGPTADLGPVTVTARGGSRPRLPGAHVPFNTVTVPLRVGDPGFSGVKQRHIHPPGGQLRRAVTTVRVLWALLHLPWVR